MKNGWASYMQRQEKSLIDLMDEQNITKIDGIGDAAYLQEGMAYGQWLLHVFYGEYWFTVVIGNNSGAKNNDGEDKTAWKHEKLMEAAKLAAKRLDAIIK